MKSTSPQSQAVSTQIVVIGGGGHSRVVIDLLLDAGQHVACVVSANAVESYRGIEVLVGDHHLSSLASQFGQCIVAVGDNASRQRIAAEAKALGFELATAIGAMTAVSPTASIGAGAVVMNGAVVNAGSQIGELAIINTGATVDHDCVIATAAHIAPGSHLTGAVSVGERTLLGVGTVVRPGITIGADTVVGAGSVVVADIPSGSVVVGNPARTLQGNDD